MTELTDSQKEILAKITDVIVDVLGREKDEITLDANFRDDLEADSLDLVELIMGFEDAFEVQEKTICGYNCFAFKCIS